MSQLIALCGALCVLCVTLTSELLPINYDVIVVGGGISGLTAAYDLKRRTNGSRSRVVVLEANNRVGGRVYSPVMKTANGTDRFDLGVHRWIHPSQTEAMNLLRELRIETHPQRTSGLRLLRTLPENQLSRYSADDAAFSTTQLNAFRSIELLANDFDLNRPITNLRASQWNQTTVTEALASLKIPEAAVTSIKDFITSSFDTTADRFSFLHFLMFIKSAGGKLGPMMAEVDEGLRIKDGAQTLPETLAKNIEVRLGQNVTFIAVENDRVSVRTAAGQQYTGKYVVMAVPPSIASEFTIVPTPFSPAKRKLLKDFRPKADYYMFIATYSAPFWNRRNLSGMVEVIDSRKNTGISFLGTFDGSSARGSPAIDGYYYSAPTMSASNRKNAAIQLIGDLLGEEGRLPIDYREMRWYPGDPFSRGGVATLLPGEVPRDFSDLIRAPTNQRIFWAGGYTATEWTGYMDGAVQAGRRAARQVPYN